MPAHKNLANMSESKGEIKASTLPAVWYIWEINYYRKIFFKDLFGDEYEMRH